MTARDDQEQQVCTKYCNTVVIDDEIDHESTRVLTCDGSSTIENWFLRLCSIEVQAGNMLEYEFLFRATRKCFVIRLNSITNCCERRHHEAQDVPVPDVNADLTINFPDDFIEHPISKLNYHGLNLVNVIRKIEEQLLLLAQSNTLRLLPVFQQAQSLTLSFNSRPAIKLK